jgi:hypothetical protein
MNEELTALFTEFTDKVKAWLEHENQVLENKRLLVAQATKDKLILDQQFKEIEESKQDMEKREGELQRNIELNRKRTQSIELIESKVKAEKERLKIGLANLGLE